MLDSDEEGGILAPKKMTAVKQAPLKPPERIQPTTQPSAAEIELRELKLKYEKLEKMVFANAASSPSGTKPLFSPGPAPTEKQSSSEGTPGSLQGSSPSLVAPKAGPPAVPAVPPALPAAPPAPAPPQAKDSSCASPKAPPAEPAPVGAPPEGFMKSAEQDLMQHFDLDSKDWLKGSGFARNMRKMQLICPTKNQNINFDFLVGQIKSIVMHANNIQ